MKALSIFFLLMTIVACGKKAGGSDTGKPEMSETLTMSREEEVLMENVLRKKTWKQSELMRTIVLTKGTNRYTMRKLDRFIQINCNGNSGTCSLSSKERL